MKVTGVTVNGEPIALDVHGGIFSLVEHFSMIDGDDEWPRGVFPIPGQITVEECIEIASAAGPGDRCRDETGETTSSTS